MNKFFISDTHFSHKNIMKYTNRVHDSIEEMNEEIIKAWNSVVKDGDTVYHLGDVTFSNDFEPLKRLRGNKILIIGNHDHRNLQRNEFKEFFSQIHFYHEIKVSKRQYIILFHYPIEEWNGFRHGSIHLHGHSHGTSPKKKNRIDVGIDCIKERRYLPYHFDEIQLINTGK